MKALLFTLLSACGAGAVPPTPPTPEDVVTPALQDIPVPPTDSLLQFFSRDTGRLERIMADGRWLVQEPGGALVEHVPESYYEPGKPRLDEDGGLRRIREVLADVGFFGLPGRVPPAVPPAGWLLPAGQGSPVLHAWAFSAWDPAGKLHVVEVAGDLRAPATFGALAPLVQGLDREVWGNWRFE